MAEEAQMKAETVLVSNTVHLGGPPRPPKEYVKEWDVTPQADTSRIVVANPNLLNVLINCIEPPSPPPPKALTAKQSAELLKQQQLSRRRELLRQQEAEDYIRRMEIMQEKKARQKQQEEAAFAELHARFVEEERTFMQDLADYLANKEAADLTKQEQLYQEWCDKVFNKIQAQVVGQLDTKKAQLLAHKRRELFAQFIEATNQKEGLFLDTIIESDYDPFALRADTVQYNAPISEDPVKKDIVKMMSERQVKKKSVEKELQPKTRKTLDTTTWSTFGSRAMKEVPKKTTQNKSHTSSVVFDHYNILKGRGITDIEFPKGKRVPIDHRETLSTSLPAIKSRGHSR